MAARRNGLTYAQAGVDIDAGNRMVELIKPLVRDEAAGRDACSTQMRALNLTMFIAADERDR